MIDPHLLDYQDLIKRLTSLNHLDKDQYYIEHLISLIGQEIPSGYPATVQNSIKISNGKIYHRYEHWLEVWWILKDLGYLGIWRL